MSSVASSRLYRAATDLARTRSRVTMVAASTAAAGMLGVSGFAIGAAPWAQAADNISRTAQNQPQQTSGQSGAFLFDTLSGSGGHAGKQHASAPASSGLTSAALGRHATLPAVNPAHPGAKPAVPAHLTATQAKAAASKVTAAKAAASKAAAARKAHAAAARAAHARAAAARPYLMYDSVKPTEIPSGQAAAVYATGSYAAQPSSVRGHSSVLWIDTNGSDPGANALDVEPGDATPTGAANWVHSRLSKHPHSTAIVYTMRSEWGQVQDSVSHLPSWMKSKVKYWIADPTGSPHLVPGSAATQWYWGHNYDITTATPHFTG